jgi:signal transduction histidine kinase
MKRWFRSSLFWRLYGIGLAAITVAWLTFGAFTLIESRNAARERVVQDLGPLAESLATVTGLDPRPDMAGALGEALRALQVRKSILPMTPSDILYRVWNSDGALIARSTEALPAGDLTPRMIPFGECVDRAGWLLSAGSSPRRNVIAIVGESHAYLARAANAAARKFIYPYLLFAVALAAAVWGALRVGLLPVRQIAAAIAVRKATNLSPLVPAREYVELDPLIRALNGTFERIYRMLEVEREFFADAAHELRTPLAVISAQAHVAAHEPDEPARVRAAAALDQGVTRMAKVLQRLLLLARLDAARMSSEMQLTDNRELIEDLAAVQASNTAAAGRYIHVRVEEPFSIRCSLGDLRMALDCLVDNALKHTPPGTNVWIAAGIGGGEHVLSVSDDGPGIPVELQERAFQRFERLGAPNPDGCGLGLAIVRRVAELHGGRALLRTGSGGRGCRAEIRLPRL